MEVIYTSQDKTFEAKLIFIEKTAYHNYAGVGRKHPKHTQCLLFVNGLLKSFGEVVKHEGDPDNPRIAYLKSAKKAFSQVTISRSVRKYLYNELFAKEGGN